MTELSLGEAGPERRGGGKLLSPERRRCAVQHRSRPWQQVGNNDTAVTNA
jgi:hypothetical protein